MHHSWPGKLIEQLQAQLHISKMLGECWNSRLWFPYSSEELVLLFVMFTFESTRCTYQPAVVVEVPAAGSDP
jgi:hypothetical protein